MYLHLIESIEFFFVILFIIVSAFITLVETSLISLNKAKFKYMLYNENKKESETLTVLLNKTSEFLSITVILNHILNISISISASLFFVTHLSNFLNATFFVIITVLVYLFFSQIIPKVIASKNPERTLYFLVPYLGGILFILKPFMNLGGFFINIILKILKVNKKDDTVISEEELLVAIDVSHNEGIIESKEKKIIKNILNFSDVKAKDIMTRRLDIVSIDINSNFNDTLKVFKDECYSRIPIYKDSQDNIVGVINLKDIIFLNEHERENFNIEKYLRDITITYEYKDISLIFDEMKIHKTHMCIVINEYGGLSGLLTTEDLIESIVGDINDEYDEYAEFEKLDNGDYIIDASLSLERFNDIFNSNVISNDYDSIGGYIIHQLNKIPSLGENIIIEENINLVVEEVDKCKLIKLRIIKK